MSLLATPATSGWTSYARSSPEARVVLNYSPVTATKVLEVWWRPSCRGRDGSGGECALSFISERCPHLLGRSRQFMRECPHERPT